MKRTRDTASDWTCRLPAGTFEVLALHGIERAEEILPIRLFDLLNLYRIDAGRAEHILLGLYETLNPNLLTDLSMERGELRQPFSYREWNRRNRKNSAVTVGDIVLAEGVNRRAVEHLLDKICRAFYRSEEYDPRAYRYARAEEIPGRGGI